MLKAGVNETTQSEWASPVLPVPKPDESLSFCVDYRRLNVVTVKEKYLLLRMDECLDFFEDKKLFSALENIRGYWQIPFPDEDRHKTTFTCHFSLYLFNRMPFGLTNAPATFHGAMDILLAKFQWKPRLASLEDIIIFSFSWEEHIDNIGQVLKSYRMLESSLS